MKAGRPILLRGLPPPPQSPIHPREVRVQPQLSWTTLGRRAKAWREGTTERCATACRSSHDLAHLPPRHAPARRNGPPTSLRGRWSERVFSGRQRRDRAVSRWRSGRFRGGQWEYLHQTDPGPAGQSY
eukprot:scaffold1314_cov386-Pavlova_lutheri.AAC.40